MPVSLDLDAHRVGAVAAHLDQPRGYGPRSLIAVPTVGQHLAHPRGGVADQLSRRVGRVVDQQLRRLSLALRGQGRGDLVDDLVQVERRDLDPRRTLPAGLPVVEGCRSAAQAVCGQGVGSALYRAARRSAACPAATSRDHSRRSSACGSRGSWWRGTRSWRSSRHPGGFAHPRAAPRARGRA